MLESLKSQACDLKNFAWNQTTSAAKFAGTQIEYAASAARQGLYGGALAVAATSLPHLVRHIPVVRNSIRCTPPNRVVVQAVVTVVVALFAAIKFHSHNSKSANRIKPEWQARWKPEVAKVTLLLGGLVVASKAHRVAKPLAIGLGSVLLIDFVRQKSLPLLKKTGGYLAQGLNYIGGLLKREKPTTVKEGKAAEITITKITQTKLELEAQNGSKVEELDDASDSDQ